MYVCKTIITNYLHINVNYHTKLLARKSIVFMCQSIKYYNKLMLHNLSSFLSHYSLILSFFLYSSYFLQLFSFPFMFLFMCFMLNFPICFSTCVICVIYVFFFCLYSYYLCSFIVHFWGFYAFCSTLVAQLQKTFSIFESSSKLWFHVCLYHVCKVYVFLFNFGSSIITNIICFLIAF
jgi:hypothetical protein